MYGSCAVQNARYALFELFGRFGSGDPVRIERFVRGVGGTVRAADARDMMVPTHTRGRGGSEWEGWGGGEEAGGVGWGGGHG